MTPPPPETSDERRLAVCLAEEWQRDGRGLWAKRTCRLWASHGNRHDFSAWEYNIKPPALAVERSSREALIACPACGEVVKQVASATLDLALWQHWNWTCPKREAHAQQMREALRDIVDFRLGSLEAMCPDCEEGCSHGADYDPILQKALAALSAPGAQEHETEEKR